MSEEIEQPEEQEEDLILETGYEWEDYIDYHETINTCYNALSAVEEINPLTETDIKRKKQIQSIALSLMHKSLSELQKEFDEAHKEC